MPPPKKRVKEEEAEEDEELAYFSFSSEGLTARQCYDRAVAFESVEDFNNEIPEEERSRFLTKAFKREMNTIMKCMDCEKTYTSPTGIAVHMKKCAEQKGLPGILKYEEYKEDISAFRLLDKKCKSKLTRKAMANNNGTAECILCGRSFNHHYGLLYHLDRCQLSKSDQPWKCYRCGFESNAAQSEIHLRECGTATAKLCAEEKARKLLQLGEFDELGLDGEEKPMIDPFLEERRTTRGLMPRALTSAKDGSVRMKFKKSCLQRDTTHCTNKYDQEKYENNCRQTFENWKETAAKIKVCQRLESIGKHFGNMTNLDEDDPLNECFESESVTICCSSEGHTDNSFLPNSQRIQCFGMSEIVGKSDEEKTVLAYCGAPINDIKVAPNKLPNGDDVICVSTLSNQFDFETDSSIVQFWRHRLDPSNNQSDMKLWFLLYLADRGVVLSVKWLQLPRPEDSEDDQFIGFLAVATTLGQILIYRICSNGEEESGYVQVSKDEPHLILNQRQESRVREEIDSEDADPENEIYSYPPIVRMSWCAESGGKKLIAINAVGALLFWDLDCNLDEPITIMDPSWQSPPTDVSFVSSIFVAVTFRERVLRILDLRDWSTLVEDSTLKTVGTRVHCDTRLFPNFYTYQAEYLNYPFVCGNSVSYMSLNKDPNTIVIVPMSNAHQITIWDIALCPGRGILTSCGVDGRLVVGASGRVVPSQIVPTPYYGKKTLFRLFRKQLDSDYNTLDSVLNEDVGEVKKEIRFEKSLINHEDVCQNMWLELEFNAPDDKNRKLQMASKDRRIESLNAVDVTPDYERPIVFTGGEAGLLFATPCFITIDENKDLSTV